MDRRRFNSRSREPIFSLGQNEFGMSLGTFPQSLIRFFQKAGMIQKIFSA